MARCPIAIALGWYPELGVAPEQAPGIHTRCFREDDGHTAHDGNGLATFEYQRFHWFTPDRRNYSTERDDERAWES